MTVDLFQHIIKQLPNITPYPIRLHVDGEPLLHPNFYQYGQLLNQNNIPFVVATNGALLKPEYLSLKMDMLISLSYHKDDFLIRNAPMAYDAYLENVMNYLKNWINAKAEQAIFIQLKYDPFGDLPKQLEQIASFIKFIELDLQIESFSEKNFVNYKYSGADNEFSHDHSYKMNNGNMLYFLIRGINSNSLYRKSSHKDLKTEAGFCSNPWQELAILSDGRLSFCCMDLSGGTAYTDSRDIWEHSLIELWRDKRIVNIRKNFLQKKINLEICRKCLADYPTHELYSENHAPDVQFPLKSKTIFDTDSLGNPR